MQVAVQRRLGQSHEDLSRGPNGYRCCEGDTVVLESRTAELPELYLGGTRLPHASIRRDGDLYVATFEQAIIMWAGRTTLVLSDGGREHEVTLDVGPHRSKLGEGAWESMIEELSRISAGLPWGLSAGAAQGRIERDALATVHPAIIEQELPRLLKLLRRFLADPPLRTHRTRTLRPLDVSRRADLRTVRWLSRRPAEFAGVLGRADEGQSPNARALADQPETVTTLDHPVTRYIAFLLRAVSRRLRRTAATLRLPVRNARLNPEQGRYARQLADKVETAVVAIEGVLRHRVFRAVEPAPMTDAVLQSLPDHPLYAALHRSGRRLIDPGLAYAPGEPVWSALKQSYDLFEILVLYRLIAATEAGLGDGWRRVRDPQVAHFAHEDRPGERWAWRGPGDLQVELIYQARFPSARIAGKERSSLSAHRVPDYVLLVRRGGAALRWIILDAKYRTSGASLDEALGDMHRYRDALRLGGRRTDAAFVIAPLVSAEAEIYTTPAYQNAHDFGVLSVYAEDWFQPILARLGATQTTPE